MKRFKYIAPVLGASLGFATLPALTMTSCAQTTKHDYASASWSEVIAKTNSFADFAKAFVDELFNGTEEQAIQLIKDEFIKTSKNVKNVPIKTTSGLVNAKVKLIGLNEDTFTDGSKKACFTFEFMEIIGACAFDFSKPIWYSPASGETAEVSCLLRNYCNNELLNKLPAELVSGIKPVNKIYANHTSKIISTEKLFPLNSTETNWAAPDTGDGGNVYTYWSWAIPTPGGAKTGRTKYIMGMDKEKYGEEGTVWYWLRSNPTTPFPTAEIINGCCVNHKGETLDTGADIHTLCGVAPAFCL